MNDRYLYRAKRTDNGELAEGYYAFIDNHHYIYTGNLCNGGLYVVAERFDIDISTLCACTSLKDKNGKLIWENDIVKEFNSSGDEWNLSQIVFVEYSLNLGWCTKGIKTLHKYNRILFNVGFGTLEAGKCEVIGNIFDNPELLEQKGCD